MEPISAKSSMTFGSRGLIQSDGSGQIGRSGSQLAT
jgi:hypothetical protein